MKSIVITAPVQNVGKTTLAMLMAFCVSKEKKVLCIDADIGRYTFSERVGIKERLEEGLTDAVPIEELGYKFDLGFCDPERAIEIDKKYDFVIIDFDISRSVVHADFYLPNVDFIILPRPPWTPQKIKMWQIRFMKGIQDKIKGQIISYPVALKYDDKSIEAVKWTYPELYNTWKEKRFKIPQGNGILYSSHWEAYINFNNYDEEKLKVYIEETIKRLKEDFKWLC